jgi:tetratricopeptide (TPR) repeat protein
MSRQKPRRRSGPATPAPDKSTGGPASTGSPEGAPPAGAPTTGASRRRKWLFRAALIVLAPIVFFGVCEVALRLIGFGEPTQFLLRAPVNDRDSWIANPQFGDRFFGAEYAWQPSVFAVPTAKPKDAVRIFVFGESAAYGDPQPDYGLPRMLRVLLGARFPDTKFEVINAAMTGINSHTVRAIADDCAAADGDVWVVYMGNNEVVGPFGAGTVFGPQVPSAAIIRSSLAIKSTRFGQLLSRFSEALNPPPAAKQNWRGMLMFLENKVAFDDARMERVYRYFTGNLEHMLDAAEAARAGVVLSTVAVNLRHCAPFASLHKSGLSKEQLRDWQTAYDAGKTAQAEGDHDAAVARFDEAAEIDEAYADLTFARAESLSALGRSEEAAKGYALARDQDALRFRCDSKLNEAIREAAAGRDDERVRLVDAERLFAGRAVGGVPGRQHFYEHVHLTFAGNYVLARAIAEQVEPLLPEPVRAGAQGEWLRADQCASQLAWTPWAEAKSLDDVLARVSDAPFTSQVNHSEQYAGLMREAIALRPRIADVAKRADEIYAPALSVMPDDSYVYAQLCQLRSLAGDAKGAIAAVERSVELLPICVAHWLLLGGAHATAGEFDAAAEAYAGVLKIDKENVDALLGLARVDRMRDRQPQAIAYYRRAIESNPRMGMPYLELGQMLEANGQITEAIANYRLALDNRMLHPDFLATLADVCQKRNWTDEALDNYLAAVSLRPSDAGLRIRAGRCLANAKKYTEAQQQFRIATELAPDMGQAHFLYGMELGRAAQYDDAVARFREAARLLPGVAAPQINLAITLKSMGRREEAIQEFQRVLELEPTNSVARKYIAELTENAPNG